MFMMFWVDNDQIDLLRWNRESMGPRNLQRVHILAYKATRLHVSGPETRCGLPELNSSVAVFVLLSVGVALLACP